MGRRQSQTLTEVELEIMQIVWAADSITVEAVYRTLRNSDHPLTKSSIRKMFSILQRKGYLSRFQQGRAFVYRRIVSRQQAHQGFLRNLIDRAFEGSALGLVATLLDGNLVNDREIEQVRNLLGQREGFTSGHGRIEEA